jgi:hypothetical protein
MSKTNLIKLIQEISIRAETIEATINLSDLYDFAGLYLNLNLLLMFMGKKWFMFIQDFLISSTVQNFSQRYEL